METINIIFYSKVYRKQLPSAKEYDIIERLFFEFTSGERKNITHYIHRKLSMNGILNSDYYFLLISILVDLIETEEIRKEFSVVSSVFSVQLLT